MSEVFLYIFIILVAIIQLSTIFHEIKEKKVNDERWEVISKAQTGNTAVIEEIAKATGVDIQIDLHRAK